MKKKKLRHLMLLMVVLLTTIGLLSSCDKQQKSEMRYDYLPVQMSEGDGWSIIDKDGKEVVREEYPAEAILSKVYGKVYWVKMNGTYQLYSIDSPKKPIRDEEFVSATGFGAGVAAVSIPNHPICLIDTEGKLVATLSNTIKRCYKFAEEGYAAFLSDEGKYGVLDTKGNIVIKPVYAEIETPSDGVVLAKVNAEDKTMLILNMAGKKEGEINLDRYNVVNKGFHEGKIIVQNEGNRDGGSIILDKKGNKLFNVSKATGFYWKKYYQDGYWTFPEGLTGIGEGTYGVVDDKGEIIIRSKYKDLINYGNGIFAAEKGVLHYGIINAQDEVIIGFNYNAAFGMLGDNFIMADITRFEFRDTKFVFSLLNKEGKEITSFEGMADSDADNYAEYINVESVVNAFMQIFEKLEQTKTASKTAQMYSLSAEDYRYERSINQEKINLDDAVTCFLNIWFNNNITEEKTREEAVSDGWFTYNRTVSDGWGWTEALPRSASGAVNLRNSSINPETLYQTICQRLSNGRKKMGEGVYVKNVQIDGKTFECRTKINATPYSISFELTFNR